MKTLFTIVLSLFMAYSINAQVTVTYKVDVSTYLDTTTLADSGIRIGGNFATHSAENGDGVAIGEWAPSDASCAMTDEGDSIWSITVVYPASAVGDTQLYKFVNGDWGRNEGVATDLIATDGCGIDDGSNINRFLEIPSTDMTLLFCWDACTQCDGSDPVITGVRDFGALSELNAYPNPVTSSTVISYSLERGVKDMEISIMDALGRTITTLYEGSQVSGNHTAVWDAGNERSGIYFYTLSNGESMVTKKIMVVK